MKTCLADVGGSFVSIRGVSASESTARDDVTQASFINSDTNLNSWVRAVQVSSIDIATGDALQYLSGLW